MANRLSTRTDPPDWSTTPIGWWNHTDTVGRKPADEKGHRPRLRLGQRPRAGVLLVPAPTPAVPAVGKVAVEVDRTCILPGSTCGTVWVEVGNDYDLRQARRAREQKSLGDNLPGGLVAVDHTDNQNTAVRTDLAHAERDQLPALHGMPEHGAVDHDSRSSSGRHKSPGRGRHGRVVGGGPECGIGHAPAEQKDERRKDPQRPRSFCHRHLTFVIQPRPVLPETSLPFGFRLKYTTNPTMSIAKATLTGPAPKSRPPRACDTPIQSAKEAPSGRVAM